MKLRTLCMLLVLVLLAVFLVINWSALSQDMTVNLVYQEIQAPLGVIVAAAFGIVVVLQAFYNLWQQASVVVELRQAHKEARNARAEAAEADKNRVNELAREVREGFARLEIDELGLDAIDRRMLTTIIRSYGGGPVGLDTLAAAIGEESVTLEDVYEPYLMQIGFLSRTPRGRCVTRRAYEHLGIAAPGAENGGAYEQLNLEDAGETSRI